MKEKKQQPQTFLDLAEELYFQLDALEKKINTIRYNYDMVQLSTVNRENLTKLEVKNKIAELDDAIKKELNRYKYKLIKQIFNIKRINSENINSIEKQKISRFVHKNK